MRNRPWPLILLAFIQFVTPVLNVFLNSWALKVHPSLIVTWWLERPAVEIFESFALMPIAGIAIYRMKRWSYVVFFVALFWNLLSNLKYLDFAFSNLPTLFSLLYALVNILLVSYFLLPTVRRTYFDRSIRWWESKPRFDVATPLQLTKDGHSVEGSILNLSEGGMLIKSSATLERNASYELEFQILSKVFRVKGQIVHLQDSLAGVQFLHTAESDREFRKLVRGLDLIGFSKRNAPLGLLKDLAEGMRVFFKTGKGLVPEIPARPVSRKN